jgi:hypothetical protein
VIDGVALGGVSWFRSASGSLSRCR